MAPITQLLVRTALPRFARVAFLRPAPISSLAGTCSSRTISTAALATTATKLSSCRRWALSADECICRRHGSGNVATKRTYSLSSPAPGKSKIWSFEDVQKLTKEPNSSVTIIDVREPAEIEASGRIPGAINIPVTSGPDSFYLPDEDFEDRFGFARPPRDVEVVFYCKAGVRSRAAASLALDAGWSRVGEYPGSWLDWADKGGPVER